MVSDERLIRILEVARGYYDRESPLRRYPLRAYELVAEYIVNEERDLSPAQMVEAFSRWARKSFGRLTQQVLSQVGLRSGQDVGAIVYRLSNRSVLRESCLVELDESDRVAEFAQGMLGLPRRRE